jgi:hypothetical protein
MASTHILVRAPTARSDMEEFARRSVRGTEDQFGALAPETLSTFTMLMASLHGQGKTDEAAEVAMTTVKRAEGLHGPDHPQTAKAKEQVGAALIGRCGACLCALMLAWGSASGAARAAFVKKEEVLMRCCSPASLMSRILTPSPFPLPLSIPSSFAVCLRKQEQQAQRS